MIKLSKLTDYAVVILAEMAREPGRLRTAADLAVAISMPEPTVAKVMKLLAKGNVIASIRGVNGGYKLERTANELKIGTIIEAMDGPIALTSCVEGAEGCCAYEQNCSIKKQWDPVNAAMRNALQNVTLAEMMTR